MHWCGRWSGLLRSLVYLHPHPLQVVSIYIIRAALSGPVGSAAQIISSIINAIQIQFFKYWYISLADSLTEWENPRTDTEFEDAMIPKLYMFEVESLLPPPSLPSPPFSSLPFHSLSIRTLPSSTLLSSLHHFTTAPLRLAWLS
jgi:hypothetical protein